MSEYGRRWRSLLACALTIPYLAVGAELMYRFTDGYELMTPALTRRSFELAPSAEPSATERKLLASVTFDKTVSPQWFFQPPSPLTKPYSKELEARSALKYFNGAENYIWNENYLRHPDSYIASLMAQLKVDDIFAFRPYDDSVLPHYRLYPNVQSNVGITNAFGWLASDVTYKKPANTVRIGMLGDSTSHNTYGRYLQSYLTSWSNSQGKGITFEVLNAGRQAVDLPDMINILRYELGPMGLDYVYLYRGPRLPIDMLVKFPPGVDYGHPPKPDNRLGDAAAWLFRPYLRWSALANHIVDSFNSRLPGSRLYEPAKPSVQITPPVGSNGRAPTVEVARRVPYLNALLDNLDLYKRTADEVGATPLISTERLYVQDGMVLTYKPSHILFETVNGPLFWPLRYRDLRNLLDFHNGAIAAWARQQQVTLVDIDHQMPLVPELYGDGFHDLGLGQRLRAWIIFQSLLPLIRHDLETGRIPRLAPNQGNEHPYLAASPMRIDRAALVRAYSTGTKLNSLPTSASSVQGELNASARQ